MKYWYPSRVGVSIGLHRSLKTLPRTSDDLSSMMHGITLRVCFPFQQVEQLLLPSPSTSMPITAPFLTIIWMVSSEIWPRRQCHKARGALEVWVWWVNKTFSGLVTLTRIWYRFWSWCAQVNISLVWWFTRSIAYLEVWTSFIPESLSWAMDINICSAVGRWRTLLKIPVHDLPFR